MGLRDTGLTGVFLCLKKIVKRAELREFRNDFPGCRVDILLDHFEGGMAEDLLEGIHIAAILEISGGEGMTEEMSPQPWDPGALLEPAEHLAKGGIGDRIQIGQEEKAVCLSAGRAAGEVPEQRLAGAQAERNHALLVPLAVYNGVTFRKVEVIHGEGDHLMETKAAVEHERAHTVIT